MARNLFFFLKPKHNVQFFYDNLTFTEGLKLMREHGYTAMPVINKKGEYQGTVTEGDFLWFIYNCYHQDEQINIDEVQVGSLVRKGFMQAVDVNVDLDTLLKTSLKQNFVPVVDDRNIFIGIVTRQKIISYLMETQGNAEYIDNEISRSYFPNLS